MMDRYDDEIRAVEARLTREREALVHGAEDLTDRARAVVVSPKGLLVAVGVGFLLGELVRSRHQPRRETPAPRKLGIGGVLGGAVLALIKAQYGSPIAFARAMWDYAAARQEARMRASYGAYPPSYPSHAAPAPDPSPPDGVYGQGIGSARTPTTARSPLL